MLTDVHFKDDECHFSVIRTPFNTDFYETTIQIESEYNSNIILF